MLGTHAPKGYKDKTVEDILDAVLLVETTLDHVLAQGVEETTDKLVVHVAAEVTFLHASLDELLGL